MKLAILVLIIYLVANAFVCATFSNVLERYQSRVVWLLPIFALIICFDNLRLLFDRIKGLTRKLIIRGFSN